MWLVQITRAIPLNQQDLKLQPIGIHIFPRLRNLIVYT